MKVNTEGAVERFLVAFSTLLTCYLIIQDLWAGLLIGSMFVSIGIIVDFIKGYKDED